MQYCFSKVYVWREREAATNCSVFRAETVRAELWVERWQLCLATVQGKHAEKSSTSLYCTSLSMLQGAWQVGCSASSRSSRLCLLTPLCWDQSGPGFILALVTLCSFVSSQHRVTFDAAGSYAVDGLKPDTLYIFSLAARSEMGLGVFTQPIECRTAQSSKYNSTQSRSQVRLQLCSPGEND